MNKLKKFSLSGRLRSFLNAFSGLGVLLKYEHNFRIHIFIMVLVVIAGLFLKISVPEWLAIAIVSGMVLSAECFNSSLEYLSDLVSKEAAPEVKKIKDVAAAGVLISAIIAVVTGLIIFLPAIRRVIQAHFGL